MTLTLESFPTTEQWSVGVKAARHEHATQAAPRDGAEREKILAAFDAGAEAVFVEGLPHEGTHHDRVAEFLAAHRANLLEAAGWIATEEGPLPGEYEVCLATDGETLYLACYYEYAWHHTADDSDIDYHITHWQPRPLLPAEL